MNLSEIKKVLAESRSNGVYLRDLTWGNNPRKSALAYLSKDGSLFMTYVHPLKRKRLVHPFSPDMENMLKACRSLVIWEGSV